MNRFTKLIIILTAFGFGILLLNSGNSSYVLENTKDNGVSIINTEVSEVKGVSSSQNIETVEVDESKDTVLDISDAVLTKKLEEAVSYDLSTTQTIHMIEDGHYGDEYLNSNVIGDLDRVSTSSIQPLSYTLHNNALNDREVMGFVTYWTLDDYASFQYDKLSTISYFSLTCSITGGWIIDQGGSGDLAGYNAFYSSDFTNMVTLAHQNNVKVVPVIKNFDPKSIRDIVANVNGAGDTLINNISALIGANGLDGVNIDFEYVGNATYPVTDSLRANFVSWHDKLAKRIHSDYPGSQVSTDVFGSSGVGYTAYDMAGLGNSDLDYIMMMTYDYIINSYWSGKKIAPMSPLYGNNLYGTPNWNVSSHVSAAASQAGEDKIIMGVPYYGIDLPVNNAQSATYNAYTVNTEAGYIETYAQINNPIYDTWHNPSSIKWNNTEKATWYNYLWNYGWGDQWRHGYYDDSLSLGAKYDFVRSNNIGGIGIWALGYDTGHNELWNTLRDHFQIAPFKILVDANIDRLDIISLLDSKGVDVISEGEYNVWEVKPRTALSSVMIPQLEKLDEILVAGFEDSTDNFDMFKNE